MTDKDFDEIRKRLYDQEAELPKDGWDKISPILQAPPQPTKVIWLRKNWWKPTVLLLPVAFYATYIFQSELTTELSSSVSAIHLENDINIAIEDSSSNKQNELEIRISESNKEAGLASKNPNMATSDSALEKSQSVPAGKLSEKNPTASISHHKARRNSQDNTASPPRSPATNATVASDDPSLTIDNSNDGANVSELSVATEHIPAVSKDDVKATGYVIPAGAEKSNDGRTVSDAITPTGANDSTRNEITPSLASTPIQAPAHSPTDSALMEGPPPTPQLASRIDSAQSTMETEKTPKEKVINPWRVSVAFTPQYLSKFVSPVVSDEILVTDITASNAFEKMGFVFALSAGRAVAPNFYLDGQLSFSQSQHNINVFYATGRVDTLIATQQPDKSVIVTPVYEVANKEISGKYDYGGVRLGGTFYFWSNLRRRFNISASAGAHYLLASDVKQKLNGNWVPVRDSDGNKTNYSFMVGAGYNLNFNRGWELMINPVFTHYTRKITSNALPYDLDQSSFGLNFMLSKTLGSKR